jgi:RNA polymerase sigma factor (TIGR02999 family)
VAAAFDQPLSPSFPPADAHTEAARTRVTTLLSTAATGVFGTDELFPVVYDELHRLVGPGEPVWRSQAQFFGAAAKAMRHILIDRARHARTAREKGTPAVEDSMVPTFDSRTQPSDAAEELVRLDGALDSLRERDVRQYEVVMLKYFAGLTFEQAAAALDLAVSTVKADWSYARAWLLREMSRSAGAGGHG